MPRADPARSAYCATRHLLRNLDNAAELRRNPLVDAYFATRAGRRSAADDRRSLDVVRGLVHAGLARCRRPPGGERARTRGELARMHAALLRCEIDRQPLSIVAAELGLSDRQVRRERRAAHAAFLHAFKRALDDRPGAVVHDIASLRLSEASELHELGQSTLAATVCEGVAAGAPDPQRRIEALCLAAEIDLDTSRYDAAAAHLRAAGVLLTRSEPELDERARTLGPERVDLVAWSLRTQTGASGGLRTPPPLAAAPDAPATGDDEPWRALRVRALTAYAGQRCDVGDVASLGRAARKAQELLAGLGPARTRERLGVMFADAQYHAMRSADGAHGRFLAIEREAGRCGHTRSMLAARAERVFTDCVVADGGAGVLEEIVGPFDVCDRRAMPRVVARAARVAAQCEFDADLALSAAHLAERLLPARNATALLARAARAEIECEQGRYEAARTLAHEVHAQAEQLGNGRIRGAAARNLAQVALAQRRRGEALRHIREALSLLEHFGPYTSLVQARAVARRLGVA